MKASELHGELRWMYAGDGGEDLSGKFDTLPRTPDVIQSDYREWHFGGEDITEIGKR